MQLVFSLYLMLYVCATRFEITRNLKKNYNFFKLNKAYISVGPQPNKPSIFCGLYRLRARRECPLDGHLYVPGACRGGGTRGRT